VRRVRGERLGGGGWEECLGGGGGELERGGEWRICGGGVGVGRFWPKLFKSKKEVRGY